MIVTITNAYPKIYQLAEDIPLGCVDPIILVNICVLAFILYVKHTCYETHDKINTFIRTALHGLKSY